MDAWGDGWEDEKGPQRPVLEGVMRMRWGFASAAADEDEGEDILMVVVKRRLVVMMLVRNSDCVRMAWRKRTVFVPAEVKGRIHNVFVWKRRW